MIPTIFFTDKYPLLKKILRIALYASIVVLIAEVIFIYLNNIKIDAATEVTYARVKTLFIFLPFSSYK